MTQARVDRKRRWTVRDMYRLPGQMVRAHRGNRRYLSTNMAVTQTGWASIPPHKMWDRPVQAHNATYKGLRNRISPSRQQLKLSFKYCTSASQLGKMERVRHRWAWRSESSKILSTSRKRNWATRSVPTFARSLTSTRQRLVNLTARSSSHRKPPSSSKIAALSLIFKS